MTSRDAPVLIHRSSSSSSLRTNASSHNTAYRDPTPESSFRGHELARASTDPSRLRATYAEEGLRHVQFKLAAKQYKTAQFRSELLHIIQALQVTSWNSPTVLAAEIRIHKVSGSLTNSVFFVSIPALHPPRPRTLLLRIYGASSESLISRPHELHILHVLSSKYGIGPRVFGTFANGRIEEHFDSHALTPADMRDPQISQWIGLRMRELHRVEIEGVVGPRWGISVVDNVDKWLEPARIVLARVPAAQRKALGIDLKQFEQAWHAYISKVLAWEKKHGQSPRVFAHNDAQYGNLLRLRVPPLKLAPHQQARRARRLVHRSLNVQIIVVDFEYASPNPSAFDIANHFHEWTTAYSSATPHVLDPSRYPTLAERQNFYRAYLGSRDGMDDLEAQVQTWSAASHGMWAVWSLVQAREQVESGDSGEFDYLGYASCRLGLFYDGAR